MAPPPDCSLLATGVLPFAPSPSAYHHRCTALLRLPSMPLKLCASPISVPDCAWNYRYNHRMTRVLICCNKHCKLLEGTAGTSLESFQLRCRTRSCMLSYKPSPLRQKTMKVMCTAGMASDQSDDARKLSTGPILDKARRVWDKFPQPVKVFPWNKALENFIQLILDLILAVVKFLSVPLFVITSISEMSYCAHERKLYFVPLPFLAGAAVAGVLQNAALESSQSLKYAKVPWHLIAVAVFFALVKLPGPYYPYWGRIFIPHFANGVIFRTLWFMFLWYRKP